MSSVNRIRRAFARSVPCDRWRVAACAYRGRYRHRGDVEEMILARLKTTSIADGDERTLPTLKSMLSGSSPLSPSSPLLQGKTIECGQQKRNVQREPLDDGGRSCPAEA